MHEVDFLEQRRALELGAPRRGHLEVVRLAPADLVLAIAHEPIAAALRTTAVPFGVNSLAQVAAVQSLRSEDALLERVDALVKERERVVDGLRQAGWKVPASEANFVWLRLGERTLEFAERAAANGVVVRPFAGEGARVTIGEVEANDIFLRTAAEFLAG